MIIRTKINKLPNMQESLRSLNGRSVKVGVLGEQAWLAGIHEFGCKIEITPKMRNFLHKQGLHIKKSTNYITIPERAFLRTGFDKNITQVIGKVKPILKQAIEGNGKEDTVLELTGQLMTSAIQDYARDLDTPSNHPFTIEKKGSSNPLVESGNLINSICYQVE